GESRELRRRRGAHVGDGRRVALCGTDSARRARLERRVVGGGIGDGRARAAAGCEPCGELAARVRSAPGGEARVELVLPRVTTAEAALVPVAFEVTLGAREVRVVRRFAAGALRFVLEVVRLCLTRGDPVVAAAVRAIRDVLAHGV